MLQRTDAQQADLAQLLAHQQDPSSPDYHHWLTPEQFADRFGVSQVDLNQIIAWLKSQNLAIAGVARARNWVAVSGAAGAVEQAFGARIHHYSVNGELHYANATEPSLPAALQGVVFAIRGLTDFRLRPALRRRGSVAPSAIRPMYTNATVCASSIAPSGFCIGPDDLATIYDIKPLYNAGLNGSGQTIAVAGQTDIVTDDITQYRTFFNLPAINLQQTLVPGSPDPGISTSGDLGESDLDLELAGAVARNATINFVYSNDVMTSAQYAIDQNLAPILSISYGDCEADTPLSEANSMQAMAQQANAQGITWFAAAGDSGATDCYGDGGNLDNVVSVDIPASLPEVTGIGGTQLVEGTGNYWSATNSAGNASALSYIPETAWNTSAMDGMPSATGGGASAYFAKPSWQAGAGVPADSARDVPDLSLSGSPDHDGYLIFSSDPSLCGGSRRSASTCEAIIGGTSVGPPTFAGLAGLLNQSFVSKGLQSSPGLGNINPMLYGLFQSTPSAYHDITTGNNMIDVTCTRFDPGCTPGPVGFSAGPGYDPVTGIGSVDASALLTAWTNALGNQSTLSTPTGPPAIAAITNAGSFATAYAPGEIISIFGSNLAASTRAAASVPLPSSMGGASVTINGLTAPLIYVSSGQLNVQVPYETPVNTSVTLQVNDNGQIATSSFVAAAAAPGIFTTQQGTPVPFASATPGQVITLYLTGAGAVSPAQTDGAAPAAGTPVASLPAPAQTVTVTVGGVNAPIVFTGIPVGLVGVLQINYQVPATAPAGPQPVVVTIGGIASSAATLTVTE